MADQAEQGGRIMTVKSPLGGDTLLLAGFVGEEFLNGLFHFRVDMMALLKDLPRAVTQRAAGRFDRRTFRGRVTSATPLLPPGSKSRSADRYDQGRQRQMSDRRIQNAACAHRATSCPTALISQY